MTAKVQASFRCKKCGCRISWGANVLDSTKIACGNCGTHIGTYGDLNKAAVEAAASKVEAIIEDGLKRK